MKAGGSKHVEAGQLGFLGRISFCDISLELMELFSDPAGAGSLVSPALEPHHKSSSQLLGKGQGCFLSHYCSVETSDN